MKAICTIHLDFETAEKAKKVLRSIQADDQGFVTSKVTGKTLEAVVESSSVASLLHTLDDYLACVSVAAEIVKK
ncbi:MAG: KEOPS complex subunit Pcc1 [Euryarchaeota archaeon]|jgi:tRNA threonylcarbamoyladenosine modification (KEOPS) complex  Pcc1 subunit|nr:KEOPS complex subunit Pcc1 [Euryarchaeota archaeon]